jgi:hypothetical protein
VRPVEEVFEGDSAATGMGGDHTHAALDAKRQIVNFARPEPQVEEA